MRIAFFVTKFPCISETFIANQIIGLQNAGHTVHIYSKEKGNDSKIHDAVLAGGLIDHTTYISDIPRERLVKIWSLGILFIKNVSFRNIALIFNAAFKNKNSLSVYELISYVGKPEYDVVHAHFGPTGNYVVQLKKSGLFHRARFVTTFHGYDLAIEYGNGFYKDLFDFCDQFTVNTKYSKRLLEALGCPADRITVLPVGLDTEKFRKCDCRKMDEKFTILFVGRLVPFKAADRAIEICRLYKSKTGTDFQLNIVGDGPLKGTIENLIIKNQMSTQVNLIGASSQEMIIELMNHSDIFLYPGITVDNRAENQGLVIQEAQAMELPVLVSDAGGMAEGVIDGVSGFVIQENDLKSFTEKIESLANNFELRRHMGKAGRKFVEEEYDIKVLNKKLEEIYSLDSWQIQS